MKDMKNYSNKKTFLFCAMLGCVFSIVSFSACDSYDDEPPRREHVGMQTSYNMPVGVPMTNEERKIVENRNKEYKIALGINN